MGNVKDGICIFDKCLMTATFNYEGKKGRAPSYATGTGVTIELATNLRNYLMDHC